jgi:iron complex outermembrane recepter protein
MSICKWPLGALASVQCFSLAMASDSEVISTSGINSASAANLINASVMNEVVVTGSRAETLLSQTPSAIGRVGNEELQRDQPKTMGDVINRIAGVSWNDLGNEQHSMGIRQPNSTNSVYQYLEDGIPIRPLGVFNHNSLNELNMADADSVEVVKGPSSSLYGSNAVGGAINLITAKPSPTLFIRAGARYDDTNGFKRYDTAISDSFGDFGFRIGHYSSRRDSDNWQEYSYGDKDSVTLRMDYHVSDLVALRATYVYSDLDTAMTGSVFETDFHNNPGHSINTFTYRRDKTQRATVAMDLSWSQNSVTTLTGFWRKNDHGQLPSYTITGCGTTPTTATTCRGTINNNHVDSLGVDIKHVQSFQWLDARVIGGVYLDISENPYVSDNLLITRTLVPGTVATTDQFVSYSLNSVANPLGVRDYVTDIYNYAPFVQLEFSPIQLLRIVVGGRYDSIKYDFENHLTPGTNYGAPNETRTFAHFSPKLGAAYIFTKQLNAYVNASEGFTAPDVSQLYGKSSIPDLKPATYRNYEVGARYSLMDGKLSFDSALYRLEGKDTIVSFAPETGDSYNNNAGQTLSKGIEFSMLFDSKYVDARLGAAYARHRYVSYEVGRVANGSVVNNDVDYNGKEIPQSPGLLSAEIGVRPIHGLRLAAEVTNQTSYWMDNANTIRYDGHTLLNFRATYIAVLWNQDFNLWAQVRNITDKLYADSASSSYPGFGVLNPDTRNSYTPGSPRSVTLGFTYTFGAQR